MADRLLASVPAVGTQITVAPSPPLRDFQGPPKDAYILGGLFLVVVLLPLSLAYARRIWTRGAASVSHFSGEIAERLNRMQQSIDATAVEVERIGEGQRFLTRIFTEGEVPAALATPHSAVIESKASIEPEVNLI